MAIAVSVLLFLIAIAWMIASLMPTVGALGALIGLATLALGVLNLAWPMFGIHVAAGVMLCLQAVMAGLLMFIAIADGGDVHGRTVGAVLVVGSILLFIWVMTFAVLQLTIVA